jgi:hypothetical protein
MPHVGRRALPDAAHQKRRLAHVAGSMPAPTYYELFSPSGAITF